MYPTHASLHYFENSDLLKRILTRVFVHQLESAFLSIYVDDTTIFRPKTPFLRDIKRQLG